MFRCGIDHILSVLSVGFRGGGTGLSISVPVPNTSSVFILYADSRQERLRYRDIE